MERDIQGYVIAAAVLDRILLHSTTINIKGGKLQAQRKEEAGYKNRKYVPVISKKFMKN